MSLRGGAAEDRSGIDQLAVLWALVAAIVGGAAALAPRWVPAAPPCPIRSALGIPCAACGTGRTLLLFAAGRPLEALVSHPLPTVAGAALLIGGIGAGALALGGRRLPRPGPRGFRALRLGIGGVLVAGWIHAVATGV